MDIFTCHKNTSLGRGIFCSGVPELDHQPSHHAEERCIGGKVCSVQQGEYLASVGFWVLLCGVFFPHQEINAKSV